MNPLTSMKIAWDSLVSVHISMFYAQRLLDSILNHFAERLWGTTTFSMFKVEYEIFSNFVRSYPPPFECSAKLYQILGKYILQKHAAINCIFILFAFGEPGMI